MSFIKSGQRYTPSLTTLVLLVAMGSGCGTIRPSQQPESLRANGPAVANDAEALAVELIGFQLYIHQQLQEVFRELDGRDLSSDQRRALEDWRTRLPSRFDQAFTEEYAADALARAWLLAKRLDNHLADSGAGARRFGDHQNIPRQAIRNISSEAERISHKHLSREEHERAREEIAELARRNPIRNTISEDPIQFIGTELRSSLGFLTSVPLIPFRTVEGITRGAGGITDLPSSIQEMARVIDRLPENTRAQSEQLYATIERSDMATTTIMSLERLTLVSERLATITETLPPLLERLPGEISGELIRTLEETGPAQEQLRDTLREARETFREGRETLQAAEALSGQTTGTLEALEGASDSIDKTVNSITDLMTIIAGMRSDEPRDPDTPRFNINDYTESLRELTMASADLRETLLTVEAIAGRDDLIDRRTAAVRTETDIFLESQFLRASELIDRIFLRAAQLLVLVFALGLILYLLKRLNPWSRQP